MEWDALSLRDCTKANVNQRCHYERLLAYLQKKEILTNGNVYEFEVRHDDWCSMLNNPEMMCNCNVEIDLDGKVFRFADISQAS